MSIDIAKLDRLNKLVSLQLKRKHIIVLNPEREGRKKEVIANSIVYDAKEWEIPEELKAWIGELSENDNFSIEEKILIIYDKLCQDYIYDDNLISYIEKVDDDVYNLPDWYGRDTNSKWDENRELHNRRVCFELSRYLAKALKELLKNEEGYNVCIFWDKNLIHYFVGLTCDDYSVTLDLDNFLNIKDLTRLKTGLTAEGITIIDDKDDVFKKTVEEFNRNRTKYSIKNIENEMRENNGEASSSEYFSENDNIVFLKNAIDILVNKYGIDSQGIFEYMKEIVDVKLGPEARTKVWKKIEGDKGEATRYIRCLIVNLYNQEYLIDGDAGILRQFDEQEFSMEDSEFIPFKEIAHDDDERYDGS